MEQIDLSAQYRELLLLTPPFDGLPTQRATDLLARLNYLLCKITKGDVVARQGEPCDQLYILIEGRLRGEMIDVMGNRVLIEYLDAPRVFATPHLFGADNMLSETFTAVGDGVLFTATRDSAFTLISEEPDILRKFLCIHENRDQYATKRLRVLSYKGVRERIAIYLLDSLSPGCDTFTTVHNTSQLADYLNVTRPALSKEMNKLKREDVIATTENQVQILNLFLLHHLIRRTR